MSAARVTTTTFPIGIYGQGASPLYHCHLVLSLCCHPGRSTGQLSLSLPAATRCVRDYAPGALPCWYHSDAHILGRCWRCRQTQSPSPGTRCHHRPSPSPRSSGPIPSAVDHRSAASPSLTAICASVGSSARSVIVTISDRMLCQSGNPDVRYVGSAWQSGTGYRPGYIVLHTLSWSLTHGTRGVQRSRSATGDVTCRSNLRPVPA